MVRVCRLVLLVSLVSLAAGASAFAQQLSIAGTVDDGTGVVPDVTVTLKDGAGETKQVTTDNVGKYHIDGLRRGDYQLIVGRDGYASANRMVVLTEQSRTVDITLQVGALSTSVDVVGAASGELTNSLTASTNAGSRLKLPSYTIVDAGVRRSLSNKMAVDFRVTNLGDAFYAYNFSSNGLGGGNWNVGQPRSFEVSLTAGF